MRTTLDIEDDVLQAAKELARRERVSAGRIVSRLLRVALSGSAEESGPSTQDKVVRAAGFRPFYAPEQRLVTNEMIDQLRDAEGV